MTVAMATLTSKGQMTIPKKVRKEAHLKAHDRLVVTANGESITLRPIHGTILDLKGVFHRPGMKPIDFKKLREQFEKGMAEDAIRRGHLRIPPAR